MTRQLWSQCRTIDVAVFQRRVIYSIPVYHDVVYKNFHVEHRHGSLLLTCYQCPEPAEPHLVAPWSDTGALESVRPDGIDTYSPSHQLLYREMK